MAIILRRNGGERALVPFYRPFGLFGDIDELAREMWDSWRPFALDQSLVPHTDIYEEKGGELTTSMCMLCLRCVEMCPYEDCLKVNIVGKTVFKSRNWLEPSTIE